MSGPMLASTNLSPSLFQSIYENLGGGGLYSATKQEDAQQPSTDGQRKMSHAHNGSPSDTKTSVARAQAAPAATGTTASGGVKKKPGRKPATTEPANKRTAQNRAAQRAFRERKERYVKELEERLSQMEEAQEKAEGGALIGENQRLRQKIAQLENENRALRQIPFAFDLPDQLNGQPTAIANGISAGASSAKVPEGSEYSFTAALNEATNKSYSPVSPTSLINTDATPATNDSSPFSVNSSEVPALYEGDLSYPLFDDVQSSTLSMTSEHDTGSLASLNDASELDTILAGMPLEHFSFTDQFPVSGSSTAASAPPVEYGNAFNSSMFQGYRDTNPFSATFNNPFTTDTAVSTDAEFDEFLSLTGAERPVQQLQSTSQLPLYQHPSPQQFQQQTQQLTQLQQQLPEYAPAQPPHQHPSPASSHQSAPRKGSCAVDAETWNRTKDVVEDPQSIDELCELFKTKAQCSEMMQLQNQILMACESGKKAEVMDLLLVAKEKKRMHMLRMKAGVQVLPPGLEGLF